MKTQREASVDRSQLKGLGRIREKRSLLLSNHESNVVEYSLGLGMGLEARVELGKETTNVLSVHLSLPG